MPNIDKDCTHVAGGEFKAITKLKTIIEIKEEINQQNRIRIVYSKKGLLNWNNQKELIKLQAQLQTTQDILKLIDEMEDEGYNRINRVILKLKINGENKDGI